MKRTFTIDSDLARRAGRKLHRYGLTLDEAFARTLLYIVSVRGNPYRHSQPDIPGQKLLESFREAADMEAGRIPRQDFANVEELFADCRT